MTATKSRTKTLAHKKETQPPPTIFGIFPRSRQILERVFCLFWLDSGFSHIRWRFFRSLAARQLGTNFGQQL